MVAASFPAFATSRALDSQVLLESSPDVKLTGAAVNFEGRLLFHNALQVVPSDDGILMANWMSSQPAEIKNQERTATLPEPSSGVLFYIGLLALFSLVGTHLPAQEL